MKDRLESLVAAQEEFQKAWRHVQAHSPNLPEVSPVEARAAKKLWNFLARMLALKSGCGAGWRGKGEEGGGWEGRREGEGGRGGEGGMVVVGE